MKASARPADVMGRTFFAGAFVLAVGVLIREGRADESLLGRNAPNWEATHWLNSAPLQLEDLAGKVVLVRFWTGPGCPYCSATAPALNEFHERYRAAGLVVVGLYHHKSAGPLDRDVVEKYARRLGFAFPVAIDPDWRTLKRWWLGSGGEKWTSVSFLIDRRGVVRLIHPGGQYVRGDPEYAMMQAKIEDLLAEP